MENRFHQFQYENLEPVPKLFSERDQYLYLSPGLHPHVQPLGGEKLSDF